MNNLGFKIVFSLVLFSFLFQLCLSGQFDCSKAPENPGDRRFNKTFLTIAAYNVEWLFLSGTQCPGTGCPWKDSKDAKKHLDQIASAMKSMSEVDIWNLEEVEDCAVLRSLISSIGDSTYKPYLIKGTDTATGQNVGLITRIDPQIDIQRTADRVSYPVSGSKCGSTTKGSSGVSKHLYTVFDIAGLDAPLFWIGAHLLAIPNDPARCSQREAQGSVLRQLANQQAVPNGYHVVMLGDLNDYDPSVIDAAGDVPISTVLNIMKNKGQTKNLLNNAASEISVQAQRWSCWYDANGDCKHTPHEHSLIDHILIDQGLGNYIADVGVMHHLYQPACNSFFSDHWPVVLTFNLG